MQVKYFLSTLLLCAAASTVCAEQPAQWHFLGKGKNNAISGISNIDGEHFLVAFDGRTPEHPRLGLLTWKKAQKPVLTHLEWCDDENLPEDMEAVTQIPNQKDYLLLESKGSVTRIHLNDDKSCKVTAQFDLPNTTADTNMEGLALYCVNENCLLAWAERGDDKLPARLSWANFQIEENQLDETTLKTVHFKAPYPKQLNQRSMSDLAIGAKGQLWVAATSDPGDDGFYHSAIYNVGNFVAQEKQFDLKIAEKATSPVARFDSENVKIEGLVVTPAGLLLGSEDENLGGKVAILPLK